MGVSPYLNQTISGKSLKILLTLICTIPKLIFSHILIFIYRFFSSTCLNLVSTQPSNAEIGVLPVLNNSKNLNPQFVTGFYDAFGSFIVSIYKNNKKK